jgi:hypothetical protein
MDSCATSFFIMDDNYKVESFICKGSRDMFYHLRIIPRDMFMEFPSRYSMKYCKIVEAL